MDSHGRFEEFLDKMRGLLDNAEKQGHIIIRVEDLKNAFPELYESEDEKIRNVLLKTFAEYGHEFEWHGIEVGKITAWLKKQGEKQSVGWSEEDDYNVQCLIAKVVSDIQKGNVGRNHELIDWLELIKNRVIPQPKQEWNEEDEKMIGNIRSMIEKYAFSQSAVDVNGELCEKEYIDADNWLKSLKERYFWKPSDEQMHYLNWIANIKLSDSVVEQEVSKHLNELLEELKKLKGE